MSFASKSFGYDLCPVCNSPITFWRAKQVAEENYKIDLCRCCGYAFVNPRPSFDFLMSYYSTHGHGLTDSKMLPDVATIVRQESSGPGSTLDASRMVRTGKMLLGSAFGENNRFLDVGSGYGFFSKAALNAGFDVVSLELAENERKISQELTGLSPRACAFEAFECPPGVFSFVLMSQILEHALDVNQWVAKARESLVYGGVLTIALPNFGSFLRLIMQENEPYITPPAHLNFFNPNSLSILLKNHGFKVEKIDWISRIPRATFEKRIPNRAKSLLPVVQLVSSSMLKIVDLAHLGMMLNVYAKKV